MPIVDFSKVEEKSFPVIPDGEYKVVCELVTTGTSKKGNETWKCEWHIIEGDHLGKHVWDWITFTDAAMWRIKMLCSKLSIDVSGVLDLQPGHFKGRECYATILSEEYVDDNDAKKTKNFITEFRTIEPLVNADDGLV